MAGDGFQWKKHPEVIEFIAECLGTYGKQWRKIATKVRDRFGDEHPKLRQVAATACESAFRRQDDAEPKGPDANEFLDLIKQNERLVKENRGLTNARAEWRSLLSAQLAPFKRFRIPRKPRRAVARKAEAMCPLLSDMQLGTCIESAAVAGLGGWDWAAMKVAVKRWVNRQLTLLEVQRSDHPVTALKLFGLGDFVEGEGIFKSQAWYLDRNLQRQLVEGSHIFAQAIGDLIRLGQFSEVDLYMLPGNHGRLGKRGEIQANADDLFIDFLEFAFKDNPQIRLHHSASPMMGIQMFKKFNILLTHGHETVAWNQVPWYGLGRDALKQQAMARMTLHYKFCGHHHQAATFPVSADLTVIMNGAWPGPTNLSVNVMKSALPSVQWVVFMHPEIGRTAMYDVRLGELPRWEADSSGIYTPVYPTLAELDGLED